MRDLCTDCAARPAPAVGEDTPAAAAAEEGEGACVWPVPIASGDRAVCVAAVAADADTADGACVVGGAGAGGMAGWGAV